MSIATEMAEWEIHALRGLVTVLIVEAQMHARSHPEAQDLAHYFVAVKDRFEEKHLEALLNPKKRAERD